MRLGGWKTRSVFERYNVVDARDLAEAQATLNAAFTTAPRTIVPLRSPRTRPEIEAHLVGRHRDERRVDHLSAYHGRGGKQVPLRHASPAQQ
jgi:hypothetical protein